ncbi:MAG: hypothetical protein EOM53_03360 [Alphaproteobacteria bacterium]|nr:hypothetical protein [Alphaproteobacteria bacterium]
MKSSLFCLFATLFVLPVCAENLPANPWVENSPLEEQTAVHQRETMGIPLPQFTGEKTTYNTAMGQEMIAPEVNITNMLLMTDYLRKIGYKIPKRMDNTIRNAPNDMKKKIFQALKSLASNPNKDPVKKGFQFVKKEFEKFTGLDIENLMSTSLKVIKSR